jgi:hypothetical protein
MEILKKNFFAILVFFAPFIHGLTLDNELMYKPVIYLPHWFGVLASIVIFAGYGYCCVVFLEGTLSNKLSINKPSILLSLFYVIPLFYAVASGQEFPRYFGLCVLSLIIPTVLSTYVKTYGFMEVLHKIWMATLGVYIISLIFLLINYTPGQRVSGIFGNPNMFGGFLIFFSSISLLVYESRLKKKSLVQLLFFSIVVIAFCTGSRTALFGVLLFSFFFIKSKKAIMMTLISCVCIYVFLSTFELMHLTDRFIDVGDIASKSGRQVIWLKALVLIESNWALGAGLLSQMTEIGTGNLHNGYLRMILMIGIPLSIICFIIWGVLLVQSLMLEKKTNGPKIFLIAFSAMNIGEDFFFGLGSSMFLFLLINICFLSLEADYIQNDNF